MNILHFTLVLAGRGFGGFKTGLELPKIKIKMLWGHIQLASEKAPSV